MKRAYAEAASQINDLPDVSAGLDTEIADNCVWVALANDRIVGGLVLVIRAGYAILANIAVDPSERGTGLARDMITLAEEKCRALHIPTLKLSTHIKMPQNVKLYEHIGWRETLRAGNKVFMEKQLTP